jgi:agmatinase
VPVTPFSIDDAMAQVALHASELLRGDRMVIAVGGDHTVALPMLRSVVREHGQVALVHFDAHLDTWDTYFNAPTTHGTIFRRAFEENLLVPETEPAVVVEIGLSVDRPADAHVNGVHANG